MWDGSLRIGFFLMELMPRFVLANKTTLILHVPCFLCSCPLQWHILKNQKPMYAGRKSSCFSCSFLYILFFNIWVMTVTSVLWWCSFLDVMDLLHRGRLEERLLIRLFKEDFDLGMDSFFFFLSVYGFSLSTFAVVKINCSLFRHAHVPLDKALTVSLCWVPLDLIFYFYHFYLLTVPDIHIYAIYIGCIIWTICF